ncbi:LOW QUALITY PROTEIN: hypothetical protein CVT25_001723 [Psilocybe cyanescens]|uniref:Uncharacterized protein n=1 Tax=Psilocybe cyanescens TaxID=93625 RepID=A0A409WPH3_PSICY|nr:LOW QUALITY PROTEIN: hypothetical protein CVT25_001723 [Psilocybe cyanescens]
MFSLFGVTIVQCWIYYFNFPNDWKFQKISNIVWCVNLALISMTKLMFVNRSFKLEDTTVRYSGRIGYRKRQSDNQQSNRVYASDSVCDSSLNIYVSFIRDRYQITHWTDLQEMKWSILSSFGMSTAIDVVLAIAMCYYLQKSRSAFAMFVNHDKVNLTKLAPNLSMTRQDKQSHCGRNALRFDFWGPHKFATMEHNLIFLGISFLLTKFFQLDKQIFTPLHQYSTVYINSYMAMLNSRRSGRDNDSSSFSVARLMNLRGRPKERPNATHLETIPDQDSMALSSIGHQARLEAELDMDAKQGPEDDLSKNMGGITIHRIEERKYDDDTKNWNPV